MNNLLSEEEKKKAIEDLKNIVIDLEDTEKGAIISLQQDEIDSLKIISNLINKNQEEIKELKERLSVRKEQQEIILVEKIKTLREEKLELIHDIEEREKVLKKEIKNLLNEIEELKKEVKNK